jgi:hypothetical protein
MDHHIEDFHRGVVLILGHLYAHFPTPIVLRVGELDAGADLLPEERAGRLATRRAIHAATLTFLAEEGYLQYAAKVGPGAGEAFSGVRLTARGLLALERLPAALTPPAVSLGERLIGWAEEAAGEAARAAARALVTAILGGAGADGA